MLNTGTYYYIFDVLQFYDSGYNMELDRGS